MEMNFLFLVTAALAGLIINAVWGFDPVKMLGAFSLLVLFLPMMGIGFQHDPQVAQAMANNMIERLVNAMPSLLIGELAGSFAVSIFKAVKGLLNTITE